MDESTLGRDCERLVEIDIYLRQRLAILRLGVILLTAFWLLNAHLLSLGMLSVLLSVQVGVGIYAIHAGCSAKPPSLLAWLLLLDSLYFCLTIHLLGGPSGTAFLLLPLVFFLHWPSADRVAKIGGLLVALFYLFVSGTGSSDGVYIRLTGLLIAVAASIASGEWIVSTRALQLRERTQRAQLEQQNSHLLLLNDTIRSFSMNLDMEHLFETMYQNISRMMSADVFFVALYDERRAEIDVRYIYEANRRLPGQTIPLNDGPTSRAIRTGQPVVYSTGATRAPGVGVIGVTEGEQPSAESMLIVPMKLRDRVIGAVSTQGYQAAAFDDLDLQLLSTVAGQAAVALANVRLYEQTRELSLTDSMTGLANARRFYQELEQLLADASQAGRKISLLMIDSDSLKRINDLFGHPIGDRHIITLAQIIRTNIRAHDLAARYAGDEFLAVLPDCGREEALQIAERIRQAVTDHYQGDDNIVQATVSIGVAMYPDDASSSEMLFRVADQAMYRAKRLGRNQVVQAGTTESTKCALS